MSADTVPSSFAELVAPEISGHARKQWRRRTPDGTVSPERAYYEGTPIPEPMRRLLRTGHHHTPEEMRVYAGEADGAVYGAVFVVNEFPEPVVRTVYTIESRDDPELRAYLWALATQDNGGSS